MNKFINTHDGKKTLSIDGTGNLASVDMEVAANICSFIKTGIMTSGTIVDFGSGQGFFQKYCEESSTYEVYSVEGYSGINFQASKDRWIVKDLGSKFEKDYEKKFDLVVSFECIEHIHESEQEVFWDNVFLCSDSALVTIHTENEQHDEHCFIRKPEWWFSFFREKGYNFKVLGTPDKPWSAWPQADCSIAVFLQVI